MKTFTTLLIAIAFSLPVNAQPTHAQTQTGFRWYVAPILQVSRVNGEYGLSEGFQAGWIVNDHLTIGFESTELETDIRANRPGPEGSPYLYLWYSGLTVEYGIEPAARVRIAGRALLGGAEAHWRESSDVWDFGNREKDEDHTTSLVVEPGAYASYGLTGWLQIVAGGSYRFAGGGKSHAVEQAGLRSFTGTIGLRVGRF